jgi:hypothetical protein
VPAWRQPRCGPALSSHPTCSVAMHCQKGSITTYRKSSVEGPPGRHAAGSTRGRPTARLRDHGGAAGRQQKRQVRPAHRYDLPGAAPPGAGRTSAHDVVRGGRPSLAPVRTHPGRPPNARRRGPHLLQTPGTTPATRGRRNSNTSAQPPIRAHGQRQVRAAQPLANLGARSSTSQIEFGSRLRSRPKGGRGSLNSSAVIA